MAQQLRIGITVGDPAGIGPEIIERALASEKFPSHWHLSRIGACEGFEVGKPSPASAHAAWRALEKAAELARCREIDAIVTGPVSKNQLHQVGFQFPGQTEFFAARASIQDFAMLLTGGRLTVALVTAHIPLMETARLLNEKEIVRVGKLLHTFLLRRGVKVPRIAVAGLNPHAGENGDLGREEIDVIRPAVRILTSIGRFEGPYPPDTIFHRAIKGEFDAVLCMYHDQGLIPLKLHAFDTGVNVTLGLPYVRTSPDHGTAFEIAGKGIARPESMIAAIQLAGELLS
ncbi:MAG: 4-hydroxythreonine-4-phosphate dehydrogenase PdxA [Verrucomicrobia bacterium]|nr:MAG: 4-hydroxythreonine-4-phosphate dehydrogenase PdxA [Verrucomicrobiota bacterium]